jgi:hypothetical protein
LLTRLALRPLTLRRLTRLTWLTLRRLTLLRLTRLTRLTLRRLTLLRSLTLLRRWIIWRRWCTTRTRGRGISRVNGEGHVCGAHRGGISRRSPDGNRHERKEHHDRHGCCSPQTSSHHEGHGGIVSEYVMYCRRTPAVLQFTTLRRSCERECRYPTSDRNPRSAAPWDPN